jgi:cytochrome c oxidase cbb3-type subunit 4
MDFVAFITDARSIMTLVSLLTFLGIIYWTFVAHRKQDFDEAAMLPFADEEANHKTQEPKNG